MSTFREYFCPSVILLYTYSWVIFSLRINYCSFLKIEYNCSLLLCIVILILIPIVSYPNAKATGRDYRNKNAKYMCVFLIQFLTISGAVCCPILQLHRKSGCIAEWCSKDSRKHRQLSLSTLLKHN